MVINRNKKNCNINILLQLQPQIDFRDTSGKSPFGMLV